MAGALCACLLGGTMVSCSDDLTPDNPKGDGTVSFSVNLEAKPGTRAASAMYSRLQKSIMACMTKAGIC